MARETPAYLRVAADIRARIANGELQPGDRITPADGLATEYGLHVTSVRQALDTLRAEGLIERRQGSGTYVKEQTRLVREAHARDIRVPRAPSTSPFARDVTAAGMAPSWEHESERTTATPRVADRLRIQVGDPIMRTKYVFKADDQPIQLSDSVEPLAITDGTPVEFPEDGAAVGVVARMDLIGMSPTHYTEDVTARTASPNEADLLGLDPRGGLWLLAVERTYFRDEVPLEFADIVFPASRYKLRYRVDLDPAS